MRVVLRNDSLFIEPETDFETQTMDQYRGCTAFVKCGLTPAEVLGIAIRPAQEAAPGQAPAPEGTEQSAAMSLDFAVAKIKEAKLLLMQWVNSADSNHPLPIAQTIKFIEELGR
jgi:hypothetical protein